VIVVGHIEDGADFIERALVLNPNLAWSWMFSGWAKLLFGEPEAAIERLARAMRLSPQDPQTFGMQTATGFAHFFAGRHDEGLTWAEKAIRGRSNFFMALCVAAASAALAARIADANKAMTRLRQLNPELRCSTVKSLLPIRRPEDLKKFTEALRLAGLPE
jgi:tetratricopeptide (TPR) repeat protein